MPLKGDTPTKEKVSLREVWGVARSCSWYDRIVEPIHENRSSYVNRRRRFVTKQQVPTKCLQQPTAYAQWRSQATIFGGTY